MGIYKIYLLGLAFLVVLLVVNALFGYLGFLNWYEFINDSSKAKAHDYVWLLVIYPLIIGLVARFLASRIGKNK